MAKELPSLLRQYDRLAAVAVLVALLVSLFYLLFAGLSQQERVRDYDGNLSLSEPSKAQVTPVDLTADTALLARTQTPSAESLLAVPQGADTPNLFTPARRLLCVQCAKPIAWLSTACAYCKTAQPKEVKIDFSTLDSDSDGLPNGWEKANKLNASDPADADLDTDGDGFTNLEEYQAKTDPQDRKSHSPFEDRMSLAGPIVGTKIPLRVVNKMELPSTTDAEGKAVRHFQLTFVSVNQKGEAGSTTLRVNEGAEIGKSGFRYVRYNELPTKQVRVGEHKQVRFVNVSTIEVVRIADKKPVTLVFWDENNPEWPGEPLLEQKATVAVDLPGVEPVEVTEGKTFFVKGEGYTVKAVDAEKKLVAIEKNADKQVFELK